MSEPHRRTPTTPPPSIPGLEFVELVGSGGYADVFRYQQQMPRMPVAVKVLKSEGVTDAIREQFRAEADTMAQLADHPYIVQVFRAGVSDDGRPFLVMKYYPPPNLAVRVRERRFSVQEVLRTGIQLASAVETAHRAGVTHRDIKPANVLLTQYGDPGLTDFGIAGRGAREEDEETGVSVPWSPPEVLFGHTSGDVRSDVYSLAATLWHLLVGRSPFELPGGDNSAYGLMPRIRGTEPPSTGRADVPVALDRLLQQSMAKSPMVRPRSALAFARSLQQVEQEERFARTPIVVLDEEGHSTTESGPRPSADDDATRVRAPQRVQAQSRADDLTRPREGPRRPATSTSSPAAPSPRPQQDGVPDGETATVQRPVAPAGAPAASRRPPGRDAGGDVPGRTGGPGQSPSGGDRQRVLLAAAGGVVVVLVTVIAVLLWQGRSGGAAQAEPSQSPSVAAQQTDDSAIDVALPGRPELEARTGRREVTFRWSYPDAEPDDTFHLVVGRTTDAVDEKMRTASFRTVGKASTTVRAPKDSKHRQFCARVRVVREGVAGPWSGATCERAS